ncbi:Hydroxyquinol 1,2-dioxygenase [Paramyrothecium foliicola]|nr:Hydroxyquinol 1,2-dioxygenase [Paramyrothecium foliicola]
MSHTRPEVPPLKDLTIENITENVVAINSTCKDPRTRFLFERLVHHLHDFARETRLSTAEWEAAIQFLTSTGKICSDTRQEFILLSDVMGLSLLIDSIDHPKPPSSTEGTVLGPFHAHGAENMEAGDAISHDPDGEALLVVCSVKDSQGNSLADVEVDIWETDSKGFYDVQYADREGFDNRAVLRSDSQGEFHFKAIVPVPYPIPGDGPVGKLLKVLGRHPYRPSHMHFKFNKAGYDPLITALYVRGDPYETSDAVFGVKESLIVDLIKVAQAPGFAEKYGVSEDMKLLQYDFVLVSEPEVAALRHAEALKSAGTLGTGVQVVNGSLSYYDIAIIMSADSVSEARPMKVHLKTWLVVISVSFVYFCQLTIIIGSGFLAQPIGSYFGDSSKNMWFNQAINLLSVAISLPVSQMADYWGRKWLLVALLVLGFAGTLVVARAEGIATVIAGFVLVGINYGCQPILFAVPSEVLPRSQRPIAQAIINITSSVGGFLGLVIGGVLLRYDDFDNYRIYFYIVAGLFGLSLLGVVFAYSPPPRELQVSLTMKQKLGKLDWVGYGLIAPGLTLFSVALAWSENPYSWSDAHIVAPFVIGVVLLVAAAVYETIFKKDGIANHALFSHRNTTIAILAVWIDGVSFFTANNYFAQQVGMLTGRDMLVTGLAFGMLFVVGGVSSIFFGSISTRLRMVRYPGVLSMGFLLLFNVLMATTTASTPEANYWGYVIFAGIGLGGITPTFMVAAQLTAPPDLIALISGLITIARSVGGVIGLAINNAIYNNSLSSELPKKISEAALSLGLPQESIGALIAAITSQDGAALAEIPGATPEIIAAAQGGMLDAFSLAFRNCWIASACICLPGVLISFFLKDPRAEFKQHIDAPVKEQIAEE